MHKDFFEFMENSTTAFQAVAQMTKRLDEAGYERLQEQDTWNIVPGDKKYVIRNDSSLIAFSVPETAEGMNGFHMVCAHSDSPCFKFKENPFITVEDSYLKLNVENYGGMIKESWFDRPLSLAGRVVVRKKGLELETKLIDLKKPLFIIPSLAVHMKRGKEKDGEINTQLHLLPLAGTLTDKSALSRLIAETAGVQPEDILGSDLYVYPTEKPVLMGMEDDLIGSPRLDDLECVYCGLTALLESAPKDKIAVLAVFDNEEVGSQTMQGAASDFLLTVLQRIAGSLGADLLPLLAGSFLVSADNAHGLHPNYTDKADPTNRPVLNKGIVIKYHGAQKYTTSAYSGAYVKALCDREKIPYQTYHNRSDIAGGSTLGNIALTSVSVPAADVGLAQLAMHSAFETAGAGDMDYMVRFMRAFYEV
ncbi:MAG: M18 family aminopeptidase [Lachnospiraceae bacterium]|nr:M18 family aminopeptidase [Lachnospiraceae bacterium]